MSPSTRQTLLAAVALVVAALAFASVSRTRGFTAGRTHASVLDALLPAGRPVRLRVSAPGILRELDVYTPDGAHLLGRRTSSREPVVLEVPTEHPGVLHARLVVRWREVPPEPDPYVLPALRPPPPDPVDHEDVVPLALPLLDADAFWWARVRMLASALLALGFGGFTVQRLGGRELGALGSIGSTDAPVGGLVLLLGFGLYAVLGAMAFAVPLGAALGRSDPTTLGLATLGWSIGLPLAVALARRARR